MTTYLDFKKRQFDQPQSLTFQGYPLHGKAMTVGKRTFLPFIRCLCVQDSPDNPCPCGDDIIWVPKHLFMGSAPSGYRDNHDNPLQDITIHKDTQLLIESVRNVPAMKWLGLVDSNASSEREWQLTSRDHSNIVKLVMDHPLHFIKHLKLSVRPQISDITPQHILQIAQKIRPIDTHLVSQIDIVLTGLEEIERASEGISKASRTELKKLLKKIDSVPSVEELEALLEQTLHSSNVSESLLIGVESARSILHDGMQGIYSADNAFYDLLAGDCTDPEVTYQTKKEHAKDVAKSDASGAVGGAVGGAVAGSVLPGPGTAAGATTGAVVMGVGSSVKTVVAKLLDWIW